MKSHRNEDLVELLADGQADLRMLSLQLLCESYATSPEILERVFSGWDKWQAADAFHEFPMLSFLPIPDNRVEECCLRAAKMVQGRKLTEFTSRCGGKIMEQLATVAPISLSEHLELIEDTIGKSKIFFRVDVAGMRDRIELLGASADQLAAVLDDSIEKLTRDANNAGAMNRGLSALEALRRDHPDYMDLGSVLTAPPNDDGPQSASFRITLQSLIQGKATGLEHALAPNLLNEQESVHSNTVEALVRAGTADAADAFLNQLEIASEENRKWIVRGLQRIRVSGLAPKIAEVRSRTVDARLWLMLLIAEVRQFDPESQPSIMEDLRRLQSPSETLIDSLLVYLRVNSHLDPSHEFQDCVTEYLQRVNRSLTRQIADNQ